MDIEIRSIDEIDEAAKRFASNMGSNKVFAFYGKMGAGKTTFIKALCRQLGVKDVIASPTFAIVNEYTVERTGESVFHFDFYRIRRLEEVLDMGFDEYINSQCLCFMEWPELVEDLLPEDAVRVSIEELPDGARRISF